MSVAALVMARKAALRAEAIAEAEAARPAPAPAPAPRAPVVPRPKPQDEVFKAVRPLSPARRHLARIEAAARVAANDNTPLADGEATVYGQQLAVLAEHRRRLKETQSIERKIELKREMLPHYADWIAALLKAPVNTDAATRKIEDEILGFVFAWTLDIGDYLDALVLAEFILANGYRMPERFAREPAVYLAEEVAEAALSAIRAGKPFPLFVLEQVRELTAEHDMPDQVRAKLHKAIGRELLACGDDAAEDGVAGQARIRKVAALEHLRRAMELDARAGVVKDIERLERELKSFEPAPADQSTDQSAGQSG